MKFQNETDSVEIEDAEYYEIEQPDAEKPTQEDIEAGIQAEDAYNASRVIQPDFLNGIDQIFEDGKPVVTKRHEIILGHYQASSLATKVMNAAFSQLDPSAETLRSITLRVADLAHLLGMKPQSIHPMIHSIADELQELKVKTDLQAATIEEMLISQYEKACEKAIREGKQPPPKPQIPKQDHNLRHNPKSFEQYNIFSKFAYDDDTKLILIKFNQDLAPILLGYLRKGRGKFTYWFLEQTRDMRSNYAQRMYEVCRYILTINDVKKGISHGARTFDYQMLRGILGVPQDAYPDFSKFERWVLKVAEKSMANKDICFSWKALRIGGSIRGEVKEVIISVFANNLSLIESALKAHDSDRWRSILNSFTQKQQSTLIEQYSEGRIKRNIDMIESMLDNEEIEIKRSKFSYVQKMIKEDSAGVSEVKKLKTTTPIEVSFIHQFLVPTWLSHNYNDRDRDDILSKGFESSLIKKLLHGFKQYQEPFTTSKQTQRSKITAAIFSGDTSWAD